MHRRGERGVDRLKPAHDCREAGPFGRVGRPALAEQGAEQRVPSRVDRGPLATDDAGEEFPPVAHVRGESPRGGAVGEETPRMES